jgi:class 3 adenylate cyclase
LNLQRAEENKRREQENAARLTGGQPPRPMLALLSLGTGINSGVVTVGLMGSDAHILNYTVFGREVNLASRLEGVSGRGRIIISDATFAELQRHAPELAATCASLPPVTVKGISQAVKIFEVPWRPPSKPAAPADKPAAPSASAAPAMTGSSAAPGAGTLPGSGGAPGSPGKN